MNEILKSASKIVFILMALATTTGLFLKIIDSKDFIVLVSMIFTYYFSNKGSAENSYLKK